MFCDIHANVTIGKQFADALLWGYFGVLFVLMTLLSRKYRLLLIAAAIPMLWLISLLVINMRALYLFDRIDCNFSSALSLVAVVCEIVLILFYFQYFRKSPFGKSGMSVSTDQNAAHSDVNHGS